MFLDELWRLGHCFQSSWLLPLSFVIHGKVSLWLAVDRFRWHLSIPQRRCWKCIRRPSTLPVSEGIGGSLFPSVRATRSDTVSVRLWNVELGLNSEKKKATSYPWSLNREKTFGQRNGLHSFHCMHMHSMFLALFGVPHLFARELLMNSPHYLLIAEGSQSSSLETSPQEPNRGRSPEVHAGSDLKMTTHSQMVCKFMLNCNACSY